MSRSKVQGWNIYEKVAIAILNPDQLKRVCDECESPNTTWIENNETKERAYVCLTCGHGQIEEEEKDDLQS